ncbi:EAL domain-containing protein [Clostridiaceae bacterium DONG20-135]|uniref:EAL domain-containing protein n=1 Tax=Copranaerobaculum intestinale TaxID=2692629 RepID=A0A6N8UA82_9FIRM|nr:EAL domain-containing protein [Copranaerobaculum intestinale]
MNETMTVFLRKTFQKIEQNVIIRAIQNGVALAIPAILCGSTALLLLSLPIPGYQTLLHSAGWKPYLELLTIIHGCTLDVITLILLITISISFEKYLKLNTGGMLVFVNLSAYLIFCWNAAKSFDFTLFQSTMLFNALLVVCVSSMLYHTLNLWMQKVFKHQSANESTFFHAMYAIIPIAVILLLFSFLHLLMSAFGINDLQSLISDAMLTIFTALGTTLFSGVIFIFLLHLMWFFGIHGGNVLDNVARNYFALQSGQIMSKTFLDTFVLFGGCGALLCLIAAIMIADKRKVFKRFVGFSTLPAVFNMNELLIFGIPIVLNPVYLVPFILTPIVLTVISYGAMFFHIVPIPIHGVEWTSPIFISGYAATGSISGSILQLVNLIVGMLIYLPFVRFNMRRINQTKKMQVKKLEELVILHEEDGTSPKLMQLEGEAGEMARFLLGEIVHQLHKGEINIHYQPQVNQKGKALGAEALLRCFVESIGYLYPPLVIALLKENGYLELLRDLLIHQVFCDLKILQDQGYQHFILSLNLTAEQLVNPKLISKIQQEIDQTGINSSMIGLELTEQAAMEITQKNIAQIMRLRKLGVRIIMDDFGMGHSSMMYLLNNQFDCVKLDGSLIKQLRDSKRSAKIIESIMQLSQSLHFDVVAEYVEDQSQQQQLADMGCHIYQGWLYSKALSFTDLQAYLHEHNAEP